MEFFLRSNKIFSFIQLTILKTKRCYSAIAKYTYYPKIIFYTTSYSLCVYEVMRQNSNNHANVLN